MVNANFKKLRNHPRPPLPTNGAGQWRVWGVGEGGRGTPLRARAHALCSLADGPCQKHFQGTCRRGDWRRPASISGVAGRRGNRSLPRRPGPPEPHAFTAGQTAPAFYRPPRARETHRGKPAAPQLLRGPRGASERGRGDQDSGLGRLCWCQACTVWGPGRGGSFVRSPSLFWGLPLISTPSPSPGRRGSRRHPQVRPFVWEVGAPGKTARTSGPGASSHWATSPGLQGSRVPRRARPP